MEYPVLKDPGLSVYELIGNGPSQIGLPLTYILDANANVRYASQGAIDQGFLIDKLNEVLASPYAPE